MVTEPVSSHVFPQSRDAPQGKGRDATARLRKDRSGPTEQGLAGGKRPISSFR
jgi:hypothetical protein